jgi:rubrerythrin
MKREADELECSNCGVISEIVHEHVNNPSFCPFCGEPIIITDFEKIMEDQEALFDDDEFDE